MSDKDLPGPPSASFLGLPLDIHILIADFLSPNDIIKLRTISRASNFLYTSPTICKPFLSRYGVFPEDPETITSEFNKLFITRARITNEKPHKAVIVEGIRNRNSDSVYFTKSHGYRNLSPGEKDERDGVAIYRTLTGDLTFLNISNPEESSVLLVTQNWEFTTVSLSEYTRNAPASTPSNIAKGRFSAWWPSERNKKDAVTMDKFQIHIHDDFDGKVVLLELIWVGIDSYDETNLPFGTEEAWCPIVQGSKSLGMVVSISPDTFGHPLAAFLMPSSKWPYAEFYLNSYYVTGVQYLEQQFAFLKYDRGDMETVCSLQSTRKNVDGQYQWALPAYLPTVTLVDLSKMGLSDYETSLRSPMAHSLDIHIQPDRAGDLVFVATGSGVTAFDVKSISHRGGLTAVKRYLWTQSRDMEIFIPHEEAYDDEDESWRLLWARRGTMDPESGKRVIAPCKPRIWKSFLPGRMYGGGEGENEMFTLVRAYNFVVRQPRGPGGVPTREVPTWQRPEFLVAWEIPLTRQGLENYTVEKLNSRANSGDMGVKKVKGGKGLLPTKIMELQNALIENPATTLSCFEEHPVAFTGMPQMYFAKRDLHKTKPRWLGITKKKLVVEKDEFRAIIGPSVKRRWGIYIGENGVPEVQRRSEARDTIEVSWDIGVQCERPFTKATEKRRSGIMSLVLGGNKPLANSSLDGMEMIPKGAVVQVKVGDSGNYLAYTSFPSSKATSEGYRPRYWSAGTVTLVILRYNNV
ncbi:hypothetical protein TWF694_003246 [Orbilia ellipsospora]|uniref:F-box domain-containing protein n=1 Tax=Orbilia ellipsospora TaxID=2528407 RepID=A0AAV9X3F5_9PEZI